ncbi:hypothetical protein CgunFtcFv8_024166 [Champsocephalus gunnari]|uniref:Uncharacterized protein n=1 Tax=Champsocephalus gunnari TaxID=52237 RepID=A0AAN8DDT6_CHAGU|nr:hypothetical protein CgunFtcFv8_024166 [Champsocephalus gunnari]
MARKQHGMKDVLSGMQAAETKNAEVERETGEMAAEKSNNKMKRREGEGEKASKDTETGEAASVERGQAGVTVPRGGGGGGGERAEENGDSGAKNGPNRRRTSGDGSRSETRGEKRK